MKNLKHEARRQNAIRLLASGKLTGGRRMRDGVYVPHVYEEPLRKLAYWDDFSFRLNKQWVSVAWVHPRMRLIDYVQDLAHEIANATHSYNHRSLFDDLTQNYKQVGNSRKVKTTSTWHPNPDNEAYFEAYRDARLSILKGEYDMNLNLSVTATEFTVEQMNYGRFVSITTPVELLNENDIVEYAHKVKAHLKGELNILEGHPNFYSLNDYHMDTATTGEEIL